MAERAIPDLSDRLTRALLPGDFAQYRAILTLPMQFTPRGEKPYVLATEDALRADFETYVGIMRLHGVTDIYRKLLAVTPSPLGAEARLLTHILVRANLLTPPFETRMRLVRDAEGWRIAEIESSQGHIHWTMGQADVIDGEFRTRE